MHGYPPTFKQNTWKRNPTQPKNAHAVQTNTDEKDDDMVTAKMSSTQYKQLMDFLNKQTAPDSHDSAAYLAGTTCLLVHKSSYWILDSGASDHICHDINMFCDYKPLNDAEHKITIPDGRKV